MLILGVVITVIGLYDMFNSGIVDRYAAVHIVIGGASTVFGYVTYRRTPKP